jgi:hypothetical protein
VKRTYGRVVRGQRICDGILKGESSEDKGDERGGIVLCRMAVNSWVRIKSMLDCVKEGKRDCKR